jgi:hypothetical protein
MSESVEQLTFKIGLSGTFYNKRPEYSVSINDTEYKVGTVDTDSDEIFYVEFTADCQENTTNKLKVRLLNKSSSDTVTDNGQIINDMLLNIKSIEIDDIDLGTLLWTHSSFKTDKPQKFNEEIVTELKNCINLGWNGTYELEFTTPFYIWLLENI